MMSSAHPNAPASPTHLSERMRRGGGMIIQYINLINILMNIIVYINKWLKSQRQVLSVSS